MQSTRSSWVASQPVTPSQLHGTEVIHSTLSMNAFLNTLYRIITIPHTTCQLHSTEVIDSTLSTNAFLSKLYKTTIPHYFLSPDKDMARGRQPANSVIPVRAVKVVQATAVHPCYCSRLSPASDMTCAMMRPVLLMAVRRKPYCTCAIPLVHTLACGAARCRAVLRGAVPCRAVPCRAVPCCDVPCRAVPRGAVPCHAVPCRAVPCISYMSYAHVSNVSIISYMSYMAYTMYMLYL